MPRVNHNVGHSNASNHVQQTNLLTKIEKNTANINVNVGDVEINVQQVEDLLAINNAKLIEISGKNTDIDVSVKANAVTVAKLNQILTKNTEIDTVLDSCSAKLTDVDDSVKANSITVAKLNQILVKNGELKTLLTDISAKTTDVDNSVTASSAVVSKLTQIKNLTDTFDAVLDASLVKHNESEAHLGNIDTGIDVLEACVGSNKVNVNISSGTVTLPSGAATEAKQDVIETTLNALETLSTNAEAHLGNIQTAVQILDNAISGNEMQVDVLTMPSVAVTNSALTKLDGAINLDKVDVVITNSPVLGAGSAAIGSVALSATDNAVIDVIAANTQGLENVNGKITACNTGAVVISSGAVTATLSATDNAVLDSIVSKNTQIETLLTAANVDHAANEALLITIDSDTDAIKTSTAACATDLAAIEVLQTAANTDLAAIEVLLTSANTDHAANEALLITIDEDTNNIKTSTAACATDLAAIEVLQTAANTDLAAIEVLLTSANTDHAANEALLITIDSDTDAIKTSTAACATDLAAIEVLQTAIKTSLLETESAVETIEACVDSSVLKTKSQKTFISPTLIIFLNDAADPAAGTTTTKTIAGSGNFTSNATANDPNIDSYIFQHVFTDSDCSYEVFESLTSGGTFFALQPAFNAGGGAPTANSLINIVRVELPFFKVKVTNANAAARNATITFIGKTSV